MEANESLIEVNSLSKKFSRSLKKSLWYGLKDIAATIFTGGGKTKSHLRKDEFWASKDINFSLKRGECLGLIGHNGAGKSTLLKMLNGLIDPDLGTITIKGKVGALIELGAGFNPLLTGRENIYINGQLIGFSKKEIDSKIKSIIEFSELGEFIDAPVQNYSSGMKVRLGFAVAAQMEPDVLIIDEVLAVGDLGFVLKCFNVIDRILPNTAVVFVSHNMPQVSRICTKILLMEKGQILFYGDNVSKGIDLYYSGFGDSKKVVFEAAHATKVNKVHIESVQDVNGLPLFNWRDDISISVEMETESHIIEPCLSITIYDKEQRPLGISFIDLTIEEFGEKKPDKNVFRIKCKLPQVQFSQGKYSVSVTIAEKGNKNPLLRLQNVAEFQVSSKIQVFPPLQLYGEWSC